MAYEIQSGTFANIDLLGLRFTLSPSAMSQRREFSLFLLLLNCSSICGFFFSTIQNEEKELERAAKHHLHCDTYVTRLEIDFPGCLPKSVVTSACFGACRSYAIPEWNADLSRVHMVENCKCCKPMRRRRYNVTLECPARRETVDVPVWGFGRCMCRPCSHGNPEPELPYQILM